MERNCRIARVLLLLPLAALLAGASSEGLEQELQIRTLQTQRDALMAGKDWPGAMQVTRRMSAVDPEHPQVFLGLVLMSARQGKLAEVAALQEDFSPLPGPGRAYGDAVLLFLQGKSDESFAACERALKGYLAAGHASGEASARTLLGNLHLRSLRPDDAVLQYTRVVEILEDLEDRKGLGDLLDNLGSVEFQRGNMTDALENQRRALAIRRELGDRSGEAKTWNNIGLSLRAQDDAPGAVDAFRRALALHRELGDPPAEGRCLTNLGLLYLDRRELEPAVDAFTTAVRLAREAGDRRAEANSLTNLGLALQAQGQPGEAGKQHAQALVIRRELNDRPGEADSLNNRALVREARGRWVDATLDLEAARALHEELDDVVGEAWVLRNLGNLRRKLGAAGEGIALLQAAQERFQRQGLVSGEATVGDDLGNAWLALGDTEQARQSYEAALELRVQSGDRAGQAASLERLGLLAIRQGEFHMAADRLRRCLQLAEVLSDLPLKATAWTDLANLRLGQGDLVEALQLQLRALELQREQHDQHGEVTSLNNLGAIYASIGEKERAVRYVRDALARMASLPDRSQEALVRNNLGLLLSESGEVEAGLVEQQRSLDIRRELGDIRGAAFTGVNVADTLQLLGRPGPAADILDASLAGFRTVGDRRGQAFTHNAIGDLQRARGLLDPALESHRKALAIATETGLTEDEGLARAGIADVLERRGETALALAEYLRAIDQVEKLRSHLSTGEFKSRYLSGKIDLYESAVALLLSAESPTEEAIERAFQLAERARARSLLDLLAESRAEARRGVAPELLRQEGLLLGSLASAAARLPRTTDESARAGLLRELEEGEERLALLKVEIRRSAPRYADLRYPVATTLQEMRNSVLRDNESLLEYALGEEHSFLWVVQAGGVEVHRLPPRRQVDAQVESYLRELQSPAGALGPSPAGSRAGQELARILLPGGIPDGRLLVVPDGALYHLPFEALPLDEGYLVEKHELAYVPSATTLRLLRGGKVSAASKAFLGVGNPLPELPQEGFPALPFSGQEVERAASHFPAAERRVLIGAAATKQALQDLDLADYRTLHFATHGRIDETVPSRSGILLSRRDGAAGERFLTLNEIFHLELDSNLVVLSACRSRRGRLMRGEGLVGITRGLFFAGARSVIVSLWNVNDRSTADFMDLFYAELGQGSSVAGALRRAKLDFLTHRRAGYRGTTRWAPFLLVGDPDAGKVNLPPGTPTIHTEGG